MCCSRRGAIALFAWVMSSWSVMLWAQTSTPDLGAIEDVREIRAALAQLDHAEREVLRRQSKTFAGLSASEKRRLRSLHADVMASDDPERLLGLMRRYHDWLASLSADERAELRDLPADERIEAIKAKMVAMAASPQPATLSPSDLRVFAQAVRPYVQNHETQLMAALSESTRLEVDELKGPIRMLTLAQRRLESEPAWNAESEGAQAFVNRLRRSLSAEATAQLDAALEEDRLPELFLGWLDSIRMSHFRINPDRLQQFLLRELSPEQRDRLKGLPPDQRKAQLQELMRERFRERRRGGRPPRGP